MLQLYQMRQNADKPVKEAVSVTELATKLGVERKSVYRWLEAGLIIGFRLPGCHYRIPLNELERICGAEKRG